MSTSVGAFSSVPPFRLVVAVPWMERPRVDDFAFDACAVTWAASTLAKTARTSFACLGAKTQGGSASFRVTSSTLLRVAS